MWFSNKIYTDLLNYVTLVLHLANGMTVHEQLLN